jgi:hypothetical protein
MPNLDAILNMYNHLKFEETKYLTNIQTSNY